MTTKLTSIEHDGAFYGVAVSFDGFPTHSHGPHATRREAREAMRVVMEDQLGHEIVKRIRKGRQIRDLSGHVKERHP